MLNEITWSGLLNYIVLLTIFSPYKGIKMHAINSSINAATDVFPARFLGLFLRNSNPNIARSLANFHHKSFSNRANLPATFVSFVGSAWNALFELLHSLFLLCTRRYAWPVPGSQLVGKGGRKMLRWNEKEWNRATVAILFLQTNWGPGTA